MPATPNFGDALLQIVALVFSVVFHEVSHGWVADRHGDPTARMMGRLTLNPLPHLDLFGSIILPALLFFGHSPFLFGYAKPVPVDPRNLRNPRADGIKVAIVGPFSNILLGLVLTILYAPVSLYLGDGHALTRLLIYGIGINAILAVFNLLPIPPLDGSWILENTLRGSAYNVYRSIRPYGMFLILAIVFLPPVSAVLIGIPRAILLTGYQFVATAIQGMLT
ncbi:MAG: site-2 protease family protein [Candidatus Eisenbacteria bacterium]